MTGIKAAEFAFPRMEAPDLDEMEEFLIHFGLVRAERTPDALYMRGTDGHHHLHAVHKGGTRFIGFAYHAADEDDLKRLARYDAEFLPQVSRDAADAAFARWRDAVAV